MKKYIWILLFLYLVLFPFGQVTRFPILSDFPNIRIYLTDIVVFLIGLVWFLSPLKKKSQPLSREMLIILSILSFSLAVNIPLLKDSEVIVSGLYLTRVAAYVILYFSVWDLAGSRSAKNLIVKSLIITGSFFAIFGWVQYFFFPDIRPLSEWGFDEHYMRLVGTFLDPGFTAIILVFLLLLIVSKFTLQPRRFKLSTIYLVVGGIAGFIALLFTYSRAGIVAFFAGVLVLSILRKNAWITILPLLFVAAFFFIVPKPESEGTNFARTTSTFARIKSWENAWKIFREQPLFGTGFNAYKYAQERYGIEKSVKMINYGAAGTDSSLLFILATTGVVGMLLFINLAVKIALSLNYKTISGLAFLASGIALLVHSTFLNSLFFPSVLGWMAILLGVATKKS